MTRNVAVAFLNFDTLSMLLGLPEIPTGCPAMNIQPSLREVKRLEFGWNVWDVSDD